MLTPKFKKALIEANKDLNSDNPLNNRSRYLEPLLLCEDSFIKSLK